MTDYERIENDLRDFTKKNDPDGLRDYCEKYLSDDWEEITKCIEKKLNSPPPWGDELYDQPEILLECFKNYRTGRT